ncbi:MAG: LTA synthase family protein [Gammaproteobacteria bacterium]|nr:LTA synthase family protein [Gammaproteobacteria bacterium]
MTTYSEMKDSRTASLLCHFSFWFGVLFATPLFIALNNQEDLVFSPTVFGLMAALACLIVSILGWRLAVLLGRRAEWWLNRLLLVLAFVTAIQGNVIHDLFYYGAFNGEKVNLRGMGLKFWIEWCGYVAIIPAGILLASRISRVPAWLPVLPILSFSILVLPAWLTSGQELPGNPSAREIDPAVFAFSSKANLVHLLPDGFQNDVVREVLEDNPDLARKFEGFSLITDHVGLYQGTGPALYTILTGDPFDLEQGFSSTTLKPLIQENAYQNQLLLQGYRLDYVPISSFVCIEQADSCITRPFNDMKSRGLFRHHNEDLVYSLRLIADLTLFRLTPMFLKEKIYADGQWFLSDTTADGSSPWPDPVIREWIENLRVTDDQPVYKWYHYLGTHIPAKWDRNCNLQRQMEHKRESYSAQAYCVLDSIARLLDRLKEADIYDQTAFVISGDHGHNIIPDDLASPPLNNGLYPGLLGSGRPAFLIKQMNNRAPLRFSEAPTSLVDIAPTALALVGINYEKPSALELNDNLSRERFFMPYSIPDLWKGDPVPHVVYRVGQPSSEGNQWVLTDIRNFSEPPGSYNPVNYKTANRYLMGAYLDSSNPNRENSWVTGRQLGFVIQIDGSLIAPAVELDLHFPDWIPAQSFTLQINGFEKPETWWATRSGGFWQTFTIELDKESLKDGENFLALQFENTYSPPEKATWQASALIRSIRVVDGFQAD